MGAPLFPRQDLLCSEKMRGTLLFCRQDAEHDLYRKGKTPGQIWQLSIMLAQLSLAQSGDGAAGLCCPCAAQG